MPRSTKKLRKLADEVQGPQESQDRPGVEIREEILDELLGEYRGPQDLLGPGGLLKKLTAALINRAMGAELTHHLGYEPGEQPPENQLNRRNGLSDKTLRTEAGPISDRSASRSRRQFRASNRAQAPAPLRWLRRQDSLDVCPRHERTRYSSSPRGNLQCRGQP